MKPDDSVSLASELRLLLTESWPVIVSNSINMFYYLTALVAVGRVGAHELAATGFALMFCNMTGHSVLIGLSSGLDTVASQLFGAGRHHAVGVSLQRAVLVTAVAAVPVSILWLTSRLFMAEFVEQDVALRAGEFTAVMTAGLWPYALNECLKRYLNAQGVFLPTMYAAGLALAFHVPVCFLLVGSLGSTGVAAALVITNILGTAEDVLLLIWLRGLHRKTWAGWTRESLTG